ncbi:dynein beta chain, ciliary [Caerostris extrusa]|uniref:Dynein beta chain, ciliary n=1 Tax=Caerostris extrusa TaxID=172846 RepID=A0AAV4QMM7_CAEEX|nr:dynein beta chain, ciliary [Caerostris extrusa]
MQLITSSWVQSKYYRSVPSRIIVLVQKICCLLIEKINEFLDPLTLFKGDRDNTQIKVKLSLDVLNLLIKSYYECREQIQPSDIEASSYPWEFQMKEFFLSLNLLFRDWRKFIKEIFSAAEVYFNIPCEKLIGLQQAPYKKRLEELKSTFIEIYNKFEVSLYNALDLQCKAFIEDFDAFSLKLQELDPKLGIAVGQICLTSKPSEEAFKMATIFQDIVKRRSAQKEFKNLLASHIVNIYVDFLKAKESYNNFIALLDKSDKRIIYKKTFLLFLVHCNGQ